MTLSGFEKRWFAEILRAMLPAADASSSVVTVAPESRRFSAFVDDFLARAPFDAGFGLRAAIWVVTLGTIVWRWKAKPFSRLSRVDQAAFLASLGRSNVYVLREIPTLLKTVGCFGLFGSSACHASLGSRTQHVRPELSDAGAVAVPPGVRSGMGDVSARGGPVGSGRDGLNPPGGND